MSFSWVHHNGMQWNLATLSAGKFWGIHSSVGGTLLKLMDECAAITAGKHCRGPTVTASMDATNFLQKSMRGSHALRNHPPPWTLMKAHWLYASLLFLRHGIRVWLVFEQVPCWLFMVMWRSRAVNRWKCRCLSMVNARSCQARRVTEQQSRT